MSEIKRTIQMANTEGGSYDVHQPLPYPFHINEDGTVAQQGFWKGSPVRLMGFQADVEVRAVDLLAEKWLGDDGSSEEFSVKGMYAVFLDNDGTMWTHRHPITEDTLVKERET